MPYTDYIELHKMYNVMFLMYIRTQSNRFKSWENSDDWFSFLSVHIFGSQITVVQYNLVNA